MAKILPISLILLAIIAITYGRSTEYKVEQLEFSNNAKTYQRKDEAGFEASLHLNIGLNSNSDDESTGEGNTGEDCTGEGNTGEDSTGEDSTDEGNTNEGDIDEDNTDGDENQELKGKPRDCYVIKQAFPSSLSGVYTIFPSFDDINGIQVYCDMETDGGGWIVFQSRYDGSVDFYRNWDEYVHGFGELTGEFWLGLETVHQLTRNGSFNLRIDLTDFEGNSVYAHYSSFSIGEGDGYVLDYNEYSGTAGGRTLHKTKFTTKDRDQDTNYRNCAVTFQGAFWYTDCHASNLNGLYLRGKNEQYGKGMVWYPFRGHYYSLKTSQMKFRPADL